LVEFLGQAYFSAAWGLWRSDGTTAGTTLVADALGEPRWLTVNGATLYFSAATAEFGSEPWKSDGTPEGTQLIKDLNTQASLFGTLSSFPYKFTVSGGVTYFAAEPVSNSQQLWRTDGTAAGTFIVKQINPGRVATFGDSIFDFAGTLYFLAAEGSTTNQELWKSDGTSDGTVLVRDIYPGTSGSYPNAFTNVGGSLLFSAGTLSGATELWRTDGSEAGTQLVKDICPGECYGDPQPR
jgi:ELWxxDGT repeat protein